MQTRSIQTRSIQIGSVQIGSVQIRPASVDGDLDTLRRLRLEFVADHRGLAVDQLSAVFVEATRTWLDEAHRSARLHSWVAEDHGRAIGLISLALHDVPPRPEDHRCLDGRLLNVWVEPSHRRGGIGSALVAACLDAGPVLGVRSWSLHATEDGRPVYERQGFVDNLAWMERLDVVKSD